MISKIFLILSLVAGIVVPAFAVDKAPPASDYDKDPEQVFTFDRGLPFENDHLQMDAIQANQNPAVDWMALSDLNKKAQEAWQELLDCNGGDFNKSRAQYLSGEICKGASEKIRLLNSSVELFLSSTHVSEFKPILAALYADDPAVLHPLFAQILLEFMAAGYPVHYGTYSCQGHSCKMRSVLSGKQVVPERMVYSEDNVEWRLRDPKRDLTIEAKKAMVLSWIKASLDEIGLERPSLADPQNTSTTRIRSSLIASRLLKHIGAGQIHCSNWGFWPKASVELLQIYTWSVYELFGFSFKGNSHLPLFEKLSAVCQIEKPQMPMMLTSGSTDQLGGPEAASIVGAWRKLYNRHQK